MKKMMINEIKRKTVPLLKKHGVVKAGIFGSYARGEQSSDVDMLVQLKRGKGYFDLIYLDDELHKKVDLLTYNALHLLKERSLDEEVRII